jgi:hypothetical protein
MMADKIFQDKYEQYCQVSGGVDAEENIDKEIDEVRTTFEDMRKAEWLEWAGEVLMPEFVKEVEREWVRKELEEKKRRCEEEQECRRAEEQEKAEAEERQREEIEDKCSREIVELMDEYAEGKLGMEEYKRKEKEIERKKAEELGEGELEKEEEEGEGREKTTKKAMWPTISVEVPARRGQGRPKKGLVDFPETDVEGETGGEAITDWRKMVRSYFMIFLFLFLFLR